MPKIRPFEGVRGHAARKIFAKFYIKHVSSCILEALLKLCLHDIGCVFWIMFCFWRNFIQKRNKDKSTIKCWACQCQTMRKSKPRRLDYKVSLYTIKRSRLAWHAANLVTISSAEGVLSRWTCSSTSDSTLSSLMLLLIAVNVLSVLENIRSAWAVVQGNVAIICSSEEICRKYWCQADAIKMERHQAKIFQNKVLSHSPRNTHRNNNTVMRNKNS